MRTLIIICIIIFSLLSVPTISAKSSDALLKQLADQICEDCQGKDINLSQTLTATSNGQSFEFHFIPWPYYNNNTIKSILKYLDTENYSFITGTCDNKRMYTDGIDGCGILKCDGKRLDINGDIYYWNRTKVDFLKEYNINQVNSTFVEAHQSQVQVIQGKVNNTQINQQNGNNNQNNQQNENILFQIFLSKGTIGGLIVAFVLKILYDIFRRKRSKRLPEKIDSKK